MAQGIVLMVFGYSLFGVVFLMIALYSVLDAIEDKKRKIKRKQYLKNKNRGRHVPTYTFVKEEKA